MTSAIEPAEISPDPAAVFAVATSLWDALNALDSGNGRFSLSENFNGVDQAMREMMRIGELFETWASAHVAFDELGEVWPYYIGDEFGKACLAVIAPSDLPKFDEADCLRVAIELCLPINHDEKLPLPIDLIADNPVVGSAYLKLRIQTVRDVIEENQVAMFGLGEDPFDSDFSVPYFGLYGVVEDGRSELIADRRTYADILRLAQNLAPGVAFPISPISVHRAWE